MIIMKLSKKYWPLIIKKMKLSKTKLLSVIEV